MSWVSNKIVKFRQMPNPYFALHIASRFLFGVGLVIAIPSTRIILGK